MGTVPAAREKASATVSKSLVITASGSASDLEAGPIDFNPLRGVAKGCERSGPFLLWRYNVSRRYRGSKNATQGPTSAPMGRVRAGSAINEHTDEDGAVVFRGDRVQAADGVLSVRLVTRGSH
jgi:hypothetical protein